MIAVDIPGFGLSAPPQVGFALDTVLTELESFILSREVDDLYIVGHSMGAIVALALARRESIKVKRLLLVDGTLFCASDIAAGRISLASNPTISVNLLLQVIGGAIKLGTFGSALISHNAFTRSSLLWPFLHDPSSLDPSTLRVALRHNGGLAVIRAMALARTVDLRELCLAVTVPTDILWGEDDKLITAGDLDIARQLLPIAREQMISDCGHWPMIERPTVVANFLLELEQR